MSTGAAPHLAASNAARPGGCAAGGFTLIELVIVAAVVAVLGAIAAPNMTQLVGRYRLQDAASGLQADVARARHDALRQGQVVHLHFQPGTNWCYAISLGQPVDCHRAVPGPLLIKLVGAKHYPQVRLLSADAMALDGRSGMSQAPGGPLPQALLVNAAGQQLAVRLGPMGRASLCAPQAPLSGVGRCVDGLQTQPLEPKAAQPRP